MFTGKAAAIKGKYVDGTAFNKVNMEEFNDILTENGFEEYGEEVMYCGYTGIKMKTKIFVGVSVYARLKHLVKDKIHGRAKGPAQILTRQPPEGRSRDGGKHVCPSMFKKHASRQHRRQHNQIQVKTLLLKWC